MPYQPPKNLSTIILSLLLAGMLVVLSFIGAALLIAF
jgi:hypothetical protein